MNRVTFTLGVAFLVMVLTACGTLLGVSITGEWHGELGGGAVANLSLTVTDTNGVLSGTGRISGNGAAIVLTASGTQTGGSVEFRLTDSVGDYFHFRGTAQGNTMTGTWSTNLSSATGSFSLVRVSD